MAKSVVSEDTARSTEAHQKPCLETSEEALADASAEAPPGPAPTPADDISLERLANMKGSRRKLLSPLDVHFSQSHIRPEFQDGKGLVDEAVTCIRRLSQEPVEASNEAMEAFGAPVGDSSWWLLQAQFPDIEVIEWRCKLRDVDGTIKTDEAGNDLYGELEWYSLDNRRLYCLQKAAIAHWPADVRCIVSVVLQQEGNSREFRKFRTLDLGRTIGVGHRDEEAMPRWSWRSEVGLPEEALPVGTPIVKAARRRVPDRRGSGSRSGRNSGNDSCEDQDRWADLPANIALFVLLYAALRVFMHLVRWMMATDTAVAGSTAIVDGLDGLSPPGASFGSPVGSSLGPSP